MDVEIEELEETFTENTHDRACEAELAPDNDPCGKPADLLFGGALVQNAGLRPMISTVSAATAIICVTLMKRAMDAALFAMRYCGL